VNYVSEKLIKLNIVSVEYPKIVIKETNRLGFYYIIAPFVALVHISPGPIIKQTSLSINILENLVNFGDKPVKYVAVLTAVDGKNHMELLQEFANAFGNPDFLKALDNVKTYNEFNSLYERYK
jgi:PTS system ascorbate-specific IIA component